MTIPGFFTLAWAPAWTGALINHLWQSTAIALIAWLLTRCCSETTQLASVTPYGCLLPSSFSFRLVLLTQSSARIGQGPQSTITPVVLSIYVDRRRV